MPFTRKEQHEQAVVWFRVRHHNLLLPFGRTHGFRPLEGPLTCIGYLGHPFEKEAPWAFIASLFLSVRWDSAIDRGGEWFSFTRENTGVWAEDLQRRHAMAA